jgi:hypothetical protein
MAHTVVALAGLQATQLCIVVVAEVAQAPLEKIKPVATNTPVVVQDWLVKFLEQ